MGLEKIEINPYDNKWQKIELIQSLIETYSLENWAKNFYLMTAGYRDQLDPKDIANPEVAFNLLTIAILGEAKARVFKRKFANNEQAHVHIGGETRPHTQEFICILSRIYIAHNIKVHLRSQVRTTPIWYSSFGVFYNNFQSGDNLTASHSPFFKGGWKPMDSMGKQLLAEEKEIISEVKNIVKNRTTINLAPWQPNENILYDFNIDIPYVQYQKSIILEKSQNDIKQAIKKGFHCSICTVGGSMKATTERIFDLFGITTGKDGVVQYFYGEEDSEYHKIGQTDKENFGPDPGKREVYRYVGAQEILLNNKANVVFIWDPDGDRLNIVTVASADRAKYYNELGLEVELIQGNDKCIVYFTPNQIYLMLTSYRIDVLKSDHLLNAYDWFVTYSVSTSRSIGELATLFNIPVTQVRVGFKYMGTLAEWLETRSSATEHFITPTGEKKYIGKNPRALIMCEESGGAVFGGTELLMNKNKTKGLIALREKDGMQFGLLTFSLAAFLYNSKQTFADYYCNLIEKYNIKYKFFTRCDVRLYDESLTGIDLQKAKSLGIAKRDQTMEYFIGLAKQAETGMSLENMRNELNKKVSKGDDLLPIVKRLLFVGDGTLLEFETFWCLIRPSGTDALIRYYFEGQDKKEMETYQRTITNIQI
ncbi:MAG: hypothetical protein HY934_09155 [Candidatus Firestonebacteria bacterium]|nr:hypothetical protein [Candidatus Firestonebacteria bacterium]